jgi:predicted dehydrogenase
MDKVRLAVIGIGNMGSAHAKAIFDGKISNATLSCVADIDEDKLKWAGEAFGEKVARFRDYNELLSSGLADAVIIATPHYLHPVIAIAAFNKGFHVLTEKPAGVDTTEVEAMNEAASASGKTFAIMFNQRTDSLYLKLARSVREGKLGTIKRFVWIINNWYRTQAYYDSASWRASWNGEGGGALLNQCPHNLDIWQWILGVPDTLKAFCHEGRFHDIKVEDDVTIYAEYKSGASAVFITSTGEFPGTNRLEISGTKGKAVVENGKLEFFILDDDERNICFSSDEAMPKAHYSEEIIEAQKAEDGHILIIRNFVNNILFGEELIAPGEQGIKSLQISNAAYLSTWTNSEVSVPADKRLFSRLLNEKKEREIIKYHSDAHTASLKESAGVYSSRWDVTW